MYISVTWVLVGRTTVAASVRADHGGEVVVGDHGRQGQPGGTETADNRSRRPRRLRAWRKPASSRTRTGTRTARRPQNLHHWRQRSSCRTARNRSHAPPRSRRPTRSASKTRRSGNSTRPRWMRSARRRWPSIARRGRRTAWWQRRTTTVVNRSPAERRNSQSTVAFGLPTVSSNSSFSDWLRAAIGRWRTWFQITCNQSMVIRRLTVYRTVRTGRNNHRRLQTPMINLRRIIAK